MQGGQNGQVPDLVCFQADSAQINTSLAAYKVHEKKQKHKKLLVQLYAARPLVQQLCLQHILTMLAQTVGQSMGRVR